MGSIIIMGAIALVQHYSEYKSWMPGVAFILGAGWTALCMIGVQE